MEASDLYRSLFEEPDESLERPDAWSEPKGFLIGGIARPGRRDLAQQFLDAANALINMIDRGQWEDYRLANPILYLYRHSLELMLKEILNHQRREHDIGRLTDLLSAMVQERYGRPLATWITDRLKEVSEIDPTSTAFRYAEAYDRTSKEDHLKRREKHVNLYHLRETMEALNSVLVRLLDDTKLG